MAESSSLHHSSSTKKSKLSLESRCSSLRKHLSKSASELSCKECTGSATSDSITPFPSPQRAKSTANPSVSNVLQRTSGFLSSLRNRWSRGRSKERSRKSLGSGNLLDDDRDNSDYAADNSSDHSSSATPFESPRHRTTTLTDSPLAKPRNNLSENNNKHEYSTMKNSTNAKIECEPSTSYYNPNQQSAYDVINSDELLRRREANLRQHSFFQLKIHLVSGHNLTAMDKSGTSDPYVKFKQGSRLLYKSRTVYKELNPMFDETFTVPIEDPFLPINVKCFDYDWGLQDDFMGASKLHLTQLELNQPEEIYLKLTDPARPLKDLGEIKIMATLMPKTQEDKEQYFQRNPKLAEASKRLKSQIWSSVVTILLVEAKGLPVADPGEEPFVKFRLGNEKYKSKTAPRAKWLEQFDLHLFEDDQLLEVVVSSKNILNLGKCIIDLKSLPRETTHRLWNKFEDCTGEIFLLLTISGTTSAETITDLTTYREDLSEKKKSEKKYVSEALHRFYQNLRDVGHLTVKVYGATGLASADIGGKSDPFCVLELVNARLQTQTEYKTLTPNWNKIFTFNVKDISSVLDVTVYDEDRDHKMEFLGRVMIPLLRIRNGEKRWYALKDKNLTTRAKGVSPQIQLEMTVVWNSIKAAIRVLEPKEEKLVQQEAKFKRQLFLRNVTRLKEIIMFFIDVGQFIQSCFEWESPVRSFFALIVWVCGCIWGDISTIPAVALLYLLKNWFVKWITGASVQTIHDDLEMGSDDEDDDDKKDEEKKTIKERLQAIQEVSQTVQNTIGFLASLGESVKNTFNFSVPELSWLTALLLLGALLVLHFIPIRALLMIWGIIKFSKRIIRPHAVTNNEVLDLLSRVPDDEELIQFRELSIQQQTDAVRRDPRKKKQS
ncbi:CLUMA_CG021376, isoform A [Clunio marinus]|uniref:CLUMA_CG021376, isoform A n=1 Tax=Clunio marinus TaxID=568069 RepID=A0A1J1J9C9_9DIPT|nr:CLUMA_CG021376, isoform A [Clunio marinus]